MFRTLILAAPALALILAPLSAAAEETIRYRSDQSYDDVVFNLENAILDRGLVVDTVHEVGDMLSRTREDVGSDVVIFEEAAVFSFCSAQLSRKAMEADPMNIAFCPYGIFVAQVAGDESHTVVGYRSLPDGAMQEVQALLDSLARGATGQN